MLTDDELLRQLSEHLPADDLPPLVRRLLRVPEAWLALHQPGLLNALAAEHEIRSLLPGTIAAHSLGLTSLALGSSIPAAPPEAPSAIQTVALQALQLLRTAPGDLDALAARLLSDPPAWRSPLACAWPALPEPIALLRALVVSDSGLPLAANALLANASEEEAARTLQDAVDLDTGLLARLVQAGEARWVRTLSPAQPTPTAKSALIPAPAEPSARIDAARCHRARGEVALARQALQAAWTEAQAVAAAIADELADLAEHESDPVTALLARQQALQIQGTPARRAAAALSLIALKRPEEAFTLLPSTPTSPEEQIALGLSLLEIGDVPTGTSHLASAAQSGVDSLSSAWLEHLALALQSVGRMELALRASAGLVARAPTNARVRLLHARLLLASGHSPASVSEASLALALDPESLAARSILAAALQAAGRPREALPHWQALAVHDPKHNLDLARCCLEAGSPDAAAKALEAILVNENPPAAAHALLAEVLEAKGRPEEARAHLERAASHAPHAPEIWIALSRLHARQGRPEDTARCLESAVQHSPESAALHAALARCHRDNGQFSRALQAMEIALRIDPSQPDWLAEQGELLRLLGRHSEALTALTEAVTRRPGNTHARLALARCHEDLGDIESASQVLTDLGDDLGFEGHLLVGRVLTRAAFAGATPDILHRARAHLDSALHHNPADPQVHYWSGELYALSGDFRAALCAHSRAAELACESDASFQQQVILALGRSAMAAGETALALRALEDGRKRFPDSLPYLTALSQAYQAAGRGQQALEVAQQALAVQPDSPAALRAVAEAASSLGKWDIALQAHQQLTEVHPSAPDAWLEYAKTAHRAGNAALARSALARALRTSRSSPSALAAAADVLAELGWQRTAQAALEHALNRAPDDPALLRRLAAVAESRGDTDTAHRAWAGMASLAPRDVAVLSRAAEASWRVGKRAAAIGLLQRAVALSPQDPALRVRLAGQFWVFAVNLKQPSGERARAAITVLRLGRQLRFDSPVLLWHKRLNLALTLHHQAQRD